MPDLWFPGATRLPGKAAGYALTYDQPNGRNLMRLAKAHTTVGVNSRGRGVEGYFQILVSRDGEITQFCEIDAYCMDSAQGNKWGPGFEIEHHPDYDDVIFTPEARRSTSDLIAWAAEWHIPPDYYDGPRIDPSTYSGWLSHRSIQQTDPHYDYWPQEDWDAMTGDNVALDLADFAWLQNNVSGQGIDGKTNITNRMVLDAVLAIGAIAGPGGITADQVRAIVKEEINKTKLSS